MFEVQLTTLPEHLYNKFAHKFLYKGQAGSLTKTDQIVLDMSHGISMCYGLCAMYMKEKLETVRGKGDRHAEDLDIEEIVSDGNIFLQNLTVAGTSMQGSSLTLKPPNAIQSANGLETWLDKTLEDTSQKLLSKQLRVAEKQLEWMEKQARQTLTDKEEKCRQLFYPTNGLSYDWYKGRVAERVAGTCQWFLGHENFKKWLEQDSGPLLVSADPGCGKSVLARYLIDHELPKTKAAVCYFFFKDQDQNTISQAFCALLHQLFIQQPILVQHAMTEYSRSGDSLKTSSEALWRVLEKAVQDQRAGPVIMVLDALDECVDSNFDDLVTKIERLFQSKQPSTIRILLTCRPYVEIIHRFYKLVEAFPEIRIPGEEESEAISQEVELVVVHRAKELAKQKKLAPNLQDLLVDQLKQVKHRTYLWAYLVFDYLEKKQIKKTEKAVKDLFSSLPKSVNEAYEKILNKLDDDEKMKARKALSIIIAARRPLSIIEMNFALHATYSSTSIDDLDLEPSINFQSYLRQLCGLFVSVYQENVYFLHQTAREFLLATESQLADSSQPRWQQSITNHEAHSVIGEACVGYLSLFNHNSKDDVDTTFFNYAAINWGTHIHEACLHATIAPKVLEICDPNSTSYSAWYKYVCKAQPHNGLSKDLISGLSIICYFGCSSAAELLLNRGADVNAANSNGRTPLSHAARNGHKTTVNLLLNRGANINAADSDGQTPLHDAVWNGNETTIKLLLDRGADINAADSDDWTPLHDAVWVGHVATVKLLLDRGADINAADSKGRTPLHDATRNGNETTMKLLLDRGADINAADSKGRTPLHDATRNGNETTIKLLLDRGADINAADSDDWTPLHDAVSNRHETTVNLLLDRGADINAFNSKGRTPLHDAACDGHETTVKLLLDRGADINAADSDGQTPLHDATRNGNETTMKLLLDRGADKNAIDSDGRTPLGVASDAVRYILIERGAFY
ncbi:ankyrin repeat-containing protein [Grosmannia clavigera kw1407]|uniref:Ankyrin repeat-containing protein n=1 Tax=Grosmannia clavigera (strain kw1407 / UAMH 11150) TaxID=655863 RepID=F0X9J3_GROCL|nr:ankyrin repeat-containing protein [Grosmannia clavigera kw1407]EFX05479.1 ankyrin repeat-containing protein [Grosmannia clavigera kw1407]